MSEGSSRAQDKRLRATVVLLGALLIEVYWLKFSVVPDFVRLYREFGAELPGLTRLVFGWGPYAVALGLAPLALVLGWRGTAGDRRYGTAGVVLAALLVAGLGVFVVWALYLPVNPAAGQIR